jgi:hypothetical protein
MKCWNPQCNNVLSTKAVTCPACGWDKPGRENPIDPQWWRCSDTDQAGNRCAKPGSLSESTRGGGPWFCHQHYPPFRSRGYVRTPPPQGFQKIGALARAATREPGSDDV